MSGAFPIVEQIYAYTLILSIKSGLLLCFFRNSKTLISILYQKKEIMDNLEKAIALAEEIHSGQKDRYGKPYIQHPFRVMIKMGTPTGKITAVLHDVIEDSDLTVKDLEKQGFPADIVFAVDCLSKRDGEKYDNYIERVKASPLAVEVKLADLEDNMDIRRASAFDEDLCRRLKKYHRAWRNLQGLDTSSD